MRPLRLAPWLVFLAGTVLAMVVAGWIRENDAAVAQLRFERLVTIATGDLRDDFERLEQVVRRGRAFAVGRVDSITAADWSAFTTFLKEEGRVSRLLSMGLIRPVTDGQRAAFEARQRAEDAGFALSPPGRRSDYYVLTYIDPAPDPRSKPVGMDLGQDPQRRSALERSRDSGEVALTGIVSPLLSWPLPADRKPHDAERMVLSLAVYDGALVPPDVDRRRSSLRAWISLAFSPATLTRTIQDGIPDLDIDLFDVSDPGKAIELFNSDNDPREKPGLGGDAGAVFRRAIPLSLGGRTLMLRIHSTPVFERENLNHGQNLLILGIGVVLSALMAVVLRLLLRRRADALALARSMTSTLVERERTLADTEHTAQIGCWTLDHGTGVIVWSDEHYLIFGVTPATFNLSQESFFGRIHPEDREPMKTRFENSIRDRCAFEAEFRILRQSDGALRWLHGRGTHEWDAGGRLLRTVGTSMDVTTYRETLHELTRAKVRAEAANEAKASFLANMSHEIRTPMNAVIGLGHLVLQTELNPKQHDYLLKINASATTLLGIIDDILDFSKIEAGKLTLEAIGFDLRAVISTLASVTMVQAAEKGLDLRFELAEDVPVDLAGDPLRLKQVLLNLLNNAIKFTDRGEVVLTVAVIERREGAVVLSFSVRDTGIGISDEQQSRLFQAFSQGDASTTRRYGGSGLGLAISRRLGEMMGGTIGVTSRPGAGSTFTFTTVFGVSAPPSAPHPALPVSPAANPDRLRGARILLAEDSVINQHIVAELLRLAGATVDIAENGQQAVDRVLSAHPAYDAVLMDVQMPGMDGLTATRLIREHGPAGRLPILALTAFALNEERRRCLAAGMDDHVTKPIDPEGLLATLSRWIGSGAAGSAGSDGAGRDAPWEDDDLFDREQMAELSGCVGEAAFLKLLEKLPAAMEDGLLRICSARQEGAPEKVRGAAHRLKGDAANLGARRVAALAGVLSEVDDAAGLDSAHSALETACRDTAKRIAMMIAVARQPGSGL